jgi:hypothetical protein
MTDSAAPEREFGAWMDDRFPGGDWGHPDTWYTAQAMRDVWNASGAAERERVLAIVRDECVGWGVPGQTIRDAIIAAIAAPDAAAEISDPVAMDIEDANRRRSSSVGLRGLSASGYWDIASLPPQDDPRWQTWLKRPLAIRMFPATGPLRVYTVDGFVDLSPEWDGFVAVDAQGYPYPLDKAVHAASYDAATEERCPECEGTGRDDGEDGTGPCPRCTGTGRLKLRHAAAEDDGETGGHKAGCMALWPYTTSCGYSGQPWGCTCGYSGETGEEGNDG